MHLQLEGDQAYRQYSGELIVVDVQTELHICIHRAFIGAGQPPLSQRD